MSTSTPLTPLKAPAKAPEPIDPVFRQVRDLVYKVCGIFSWKKSSTSWRMRAGAA
jgi:hypothetical protein